MSAELLPLLKHATLLLSATLLGVLALRGPWLRSFGARNVMLLWLSVPASLLALLFPAPLRYVEGGGLSMVIRETGSPAVPASVALPQPAYTIDADIVLAAAWLAGAAAMTAILALRQWRYRRALGRLEARPDGSFRSEFEHPGPALVGALRPRIVVPADFEARFTPAQRALILAHERCHLERGDAQLTLAACVIRCLFWFNPLVHLAWSRFRFDQELACDATVLRNRPQSRREYAEAMLSTQYDAGRLPVGCTWLTGPSLRRRITMVYTHSPRRLRLLAGTVMALAASTAAAVGAWSSQEPQLRYQSVHAPQLDLATVTATPIATGSAPPERAARFNAPSLASVAAPHAARIEASLAPPAPTTNGTPVRSAPAASADSTAPAAAPSPSAPENDDDAPATEPAAAPDAAPPASARSAQSADVEPARLVQASRPSFPRTFNKPQLVSYPGMPRSQQPGADWQPEGNLWSLEVRVLLDEKGQPVKASIADNDLSSDGMVRRYERLALRAVKGWRYEPARVDGEPVASELFMAFHFDTRIGRPHDIGDPPYQVNQPNRLNTKYTHR